MGEAPVDGHAHGPIDGVPGRGERRGDLLPRQALGPPGEEPGVGIGQSVLAGGPRESLDPHAAARAGHAAHGVEEDHGDVPQGHEVEAPDRLRVVARGPAPALRAPRAGPGAGPYPDLDAQPRVLHQPHRLVDERRVLLDPIQDTLELHPVLLPRRLGVPTPNCRGFRNGMRSVVKVAFCHSERGRRPSDAGVGNWSSSDKSRDARARSRRPGSGAVSDGPPRQRSIHVVKGPDRGKARPPRVVNPYIRAPAPTCTYDGRTSPPIPTSPPVSVRTDRGVTVPARGSDGRARRTRRPANPCTCRARSMTLILCGGLRKSGQSSTSRS